MRFVTPPTQTPLVHLDLGAGLTACNRTITGKWRILSPSNRFHGLCLQCSNAMKRRLTGTTTRHAHPVIVTVRGLSDPVCPRCGAERLDSARRRDGDVCRLVCPTCRHQWCMIVDFVWDYVVDPEEQTEP